MTPMASPDGLRAFAKQHRVYAEIFPHYDMDGERLVQTGFDLGLLALPPECCPGDPGCPECQRVETRLRDIALTALPAGWRHTAEPFDAAFHYRSETGWHPEIEAVVHMLPYEGLRAVDAAALRELPKVRERLRDLGVGDEVPAHAGQRT
jgi:hypothetical protein